MHTHTHTQPHQQFGWILNVNCTRKQDHYFFSLFFSPNLMLLKFDGNEKKNNCNVRILFNKYFVTLTEMFNAIRFSCSRLDMSIFMLLKMNSLQFSWKNQYITIQMSDFQSFTFLSFPTSISLSLSFFRVFIFIIISKACCHLFYVVVLFSLLIIIAC